MIICAQLSVNFLVIRALRTDYSSLYRFASSCIFDIMQFRRHYARDKRNANFDHYFWQKSKVYVEEGVRYLLQSFTTSFIVFISGSRNAIYVYNQKYGTFCARAIIMVIRLIINMLIFCIIQLTTTY